MSVFDIVIVCLLGAGAIIGFFVAHAAIRHSRPWTVYFLWGSLAFAGAFFLHRLLSEKLDSYSSFILVSAGGEGLNYRSLILMLAYFIVISVLLVVLQTYLDPFASRHRVLFSFLSAFGLPLFGLLVFALILPALPSGALTSLAESKVYLWLSENVVAPMLALF